MKMKTLLKISIGLNLGLAGGLMVMLLNGQRRVADPAPQTVAETRPSVNEVAVATPQTSSQAELKPFRWSQLDAKDYHIYVKNLRGIGCPEATVRAIVTADVESVYRKHGRELEQKLSALAGSPWSTRIAANNTEVALKAELQQLPGEETATIADLLGLKPDPAPATATVADNTPHKRTSHNRPQDRPVSMPLILQNVDPAALNLNDQQIEVINNLRQSFMEQVGGPDQDPNDPAYLERWQKAQPKADEMLRGMLGVTVWQNYQLAAQP